MVAGFGTFIGHGCANRAQSGYVQAMDAPVPTLSTPAPRSGRGSLWRAWASDRALQEAHDAQVSTRLGRFGLPFHVFFAMAWGVTCVGPISAVEIGWAPVLVTTALRLPYAWRAIASVWRLPIFWALFALAAWAHVSLAWTPDMHQGVRDAGTIRFALVLIALWPVIHARRAVILSMVFAFLVAGAAQALEVYGHRTGREWLIWPHPELPPELPMRFSAWWKQPAVGGAMLVGALGLNLPAMLGLFDGVKRRWAWRALGTIGCATAVFGILASGTRGAMLAGAGLFAITAVAAAWKMWSNRGRRKNAAATRVRRHSGIVAAIVAGLLLVATAWVVMFGPIGAQVSSRVNAGYTEVREALTNANYASDTGARILMAKWAAEAFLEKPLVGHGAGSFREIAERKIAADPRAAGVRAHTQAHNTLLHVAATLGAVGAALLAWITYAALMGGKRGAKDDARDAVDPAHWTQIGRAYDLGPVCALVGMVLMSAFDTVLVNTQEAALVLTLAALCVPTWLSAPRRA